MPTCPSCDSQQTVKKSTGKTQKKGRLTIQCDELWSFVDNKGNKQWVWLALDVDTRDTVAIISLRTYLINSRFNS